MKKSFLITAYVAILIMWFNAFAMLFSAMLDKHTLFVINLEIFSVIFVFLVTITFIRFGVKNTWLWTKEFFHNFNEYLKNLHGDGRLY